MPTKPIYTVSQLTLEIKKILEDKFPFIWINGEITNMYTAASGHRYFNLKDESAMIKAVIFQSQVKTLRFEPENGLEILGLGRISVYGPRGTYQVILEYMEPAGIGALQIAFEQLKKRLEQEGLFAEDHKKPLPLIPQTIGVVTSLAGAAIHDIIKVVYRRFNNLRLIIAPAKVQGIEAEKEIVSAIGMLNRHNQADIILLARGGGSLEDIQAFNSETVGRAIHASIIPIVSAVGHEVDYTISDFVADMRAPTPSAAAEIIVPEKEELINRIRRLTDDLIRSIRTYMGDNRNRLWSLFTSLKNPGHRIEEYRLNLDHQTNRLTNRIQQLLQQNYHRITLQIAMLKSLNPINHIIKYKEKNNTIYVNLLKLKINYLENRRLRLRRLGSTLTALNPMAILERGYSVTRTVTKGRPKIIMDASKVDINQPLDVVLARGSLRVSVKDKNFDGKIKGMSTNGQKTDL